jgi:hypothetical protein
VSKGLKYLRFCKIVFKTKIKDQSQVQNQIFGLRTRVLLYNMHRGEILGRFKNLVCIVVKCLLELTTILADTT